MKINFKIELFFFFLFISGEVFAQEKPFRLGVKIGFPNIIGGHLEYVTPLLENKLAASIDYSSINTDNYIDPDEGKLTYFEVGLNYYFFTLHI